VVFADVLEEFQALEEQPLAHLTFYIIDSHRPLHLANVYDDDRVYLFDDGMTKIPKMEDVVYNSEDDDDEDEEEEALDQSSDEEDEGVDGEDAEGGGGAKKKESKSKRRRMDGRMSPRSRREHRETVALRAEDYYRSSSYGASAAVLLWQLAGDLGKPDNALLWLSIVGLTDQFVHDRIDNTTYTLLFDQLSTDVNRMNSTDEEGEALDRIKISVTEELRVLLMRHWTVHDAMLHSRYVSTRMGTWRQRGKTQLKNLLAKMGMSLEQCNQKFTSMDLQSKDRYGARFATKIHTRGCH